MLALPPDQKPITDTSAEMDQMDDAHANLTPVMDLITTVMKDELMQREMGEGEEAQHRQPLIANRS